MVMLFGNSNTSMKTVGRDLQNRVWPEVDRGRLDLNWRQLEKAASNTDEPFWICLVERFARGSRAVRERHFRMEALYPKYERVLDLTTNPSAKPVSCES